MNAHLQRPCPPGLRAPAALPSPLPLTVLCVQTAYSHWSPHSGYHRFIPHLEPDFRIELHHSPYNYWQGPGLLPRLGQRLQRRLVTGWTTQHDIFTELRLIVRVRRLLRHGRRVVIHFLDGERGCCLFYFLFKEARKADRLRIYLSFHQPPAILRQVVHRPHLLRRANGVFVVASAQLPFFSFLPQTRLHHIPHGVDTDFFHPHPHPSPAASTETQLLTVGSHLRDFDLLQTIIETSPPGYHFHIVGAGEAADHLAAHDKVTTHHAIPEPDLLELYQSCDLGLMPLKDSTANNVILEMMACGLPVVCNDVGGVAEYLGEEGGALVPLPSGQAFWNAITRLCTATARERSQHRHAARRRALRYAWPTIARRIAAIYRAP